MTAAKSDPLVHLPCHRDGDSVRRVVKNSTINLVAYGLNAAFNLLGLCMLTRCLGKDDLGYYYTVYTWMIFVQLVTEAGIPTILTCRIVQDHACWKQTAAEAGGMLVLVISAGTVALLGVGATWSVWHGNTGPLVLFAAAAVACAAMHVQRFCAGVFQAYEMFAAESLAKIVQGGLYMSLIGVLLLQRINSPALALAFFAGSHVLVSLFMVVSLQRRFRCIGVRFDRGMAASWLSESGPLGAADVLRRVTWQVDTLLLALLQPAWVVGLYSVAWRPLSSLNWIPHVVLSTILPSFTRMAEHDPKGLDRAFATSVRYLWIASLPIAVSICVFADPFVIFLAGREYLESALPMRLLIWLTCLWFVSVPYRFYLTALGRARQYAGLVVFGLLSVTVAETLLIPTFGYLGACSGSLLGEFALTAVGLVLCLRQGGTRLEWGAMLRAVAAAAVMAGLLWLGRDLHWWWIAPQVLGAGAVYLAICLGLGALRWAEIRRLLARKRPLESPATACPPLQPAAAMQPTREVPV